MLATKHIEQLKFLAQEKANTEYFDFHAILIQKVYKGYMSRKYIHSFYHRKQALENLQEVEAKTRKMMADYVQEQKDRLKVAWYYQSEELSNQHVHFKTLAGKLHHLISTETIPGIYNPPYSSRPTAFGQEVEAQLKTIFKEKYAQSQQLGKARRLPSLRSTALPGSLPRSTQRVDPGLSTNPNY